MKNKLAVCLLSVGLMIFLCSPAAADSLVIDIDPGIDAILDLDTNPQWVTPSNPDDEEAWLEGLLGLTYDDPSVEFISKDEDSNPLDDVPSNWVYAVLKYGVGQPAIANPDHWAIMDDGDFILELAGIPGLPTTGLSHVSYFTGVSVPEPSTMLLLGLGLVGLVTYGRKKLIK